MTGLKTAGDSLINFLVTTKDYTEALIASRDHTKKNSMHKKSNGYKKIRNPMDKNARILTTFLVQHEIFHRGNSLDCDSKDFGGW